MTDMKMTDQIAGHVNAGHENAGHEIPGHEIARHDKYLYCGKFDVIFTVNCSLTAALRTRIDSISLNFSFFLYCDADVTAMELCNVIMK